MVVIKLVVTLLKKIFLRTRKNYRLHIVINASRYKLFTITPRFHSATVTSV